MEMPTLQYAIYYSIAMMMTEYDMCKDGYGEKDMYNDEYLTGSTAWGIGQ